MKVAQPMSTVAQTAPQLYCQLVAAGIDSSGSSTHSGTQ